MFLNFKKFMLRLAYVFFRLRSYLLARIQGGMAKIFKALKIYTDKLFQVHLKTYLRLITLSAKTPDKNTGKSNHLMSLTFHNSYFYVYNIL